MAMINSIKKFFKRKKKDVSRKPDTHLRSSEGNVTGADHDKTDLPRAWTGVDLDGTLALHDRSSSYTHVGEPVPAMLALVKKMINNGIRVKIFTARAQDPRQEPIIRKWLETNGLPQLEITNMKDYSMVRLYDDRCIQVEHNTGRLIVDK